MTTLQVDGMSCGGCVKSVTKIISRAAEIDAGEVEVDLDSAQADFPDTDQLELVLEKLEAAGFPARKKAS